MHQERTDVQQIAQWAAGAILEAPFSPQHHDVTAAALSLFRPEAAASVRHQTTLLDTFLHFEVITVFSETFLKYRSFEFLFSVHISFGKRKHLIQLRFF